MTAIPYKRTGVPTTDERRELLLAWLRSHPTVTGQPTRAIAFHCPATRYYDPTHGDLKALERQGLVAREGHPARWKAARG